MILEAEIRIEKTQEYLGILKQYSEKPHKNELIFNSEKLEKLRNLGRLELLCIGAELIPVGEFREIYFQKSKIIIDESNTVPTNWSVSRQY